jgi:hypothetical protein
MLARRVGTTTLLVVRRARGQAFSTIGEARFDAVMNHAG